MGWLKGELLPLCSILVISGEEEYSDTVSKQSTAASCGGGSYRLMRKGGEGHLTTSSGNRSEALLQSKESFPPPSVIFRIL